MTADDWEPLPPEQLCRHPGELGALPSAAAPAPPGAPPARPAAPPVPSPPAAPDPAAEQALFALKQRLQQQGKGRSLIAAVQHREQRQQRQQAARGVASLQATLVHIEAPAAPASPPPPPPECTVDERASDFDARELEPWFRELPDTERQRLRTVWWHERHRDDHALQGLRVRLQRAASYGAMVLGGLGLLQSLMLGGFQTVLPLAVLGAIAAVIAELGGGGRFLYAALGPVAWVAVMGPIVLVTPFAMPGVLLAAYGFGAIGMDGEMRRSAGFVDQLPPTPPAAPDATAPAPAPAAVPPAAAPAAAAPAARR
ncbi:MAG: hypothetical protein MUC36_14485 [Planctomycetes bacterium]|nr:hypothetical protein [Planctomycetota bacterium]